MEYSSLKARVTLIYLFVFTFTGSRCSCGSNKDGKTQKEHFKLLVKEKKNKIYKRFIRLLSRSKLSRFLVFLGLKHKLNFLSSEYLRKLLNQKLNSPFFSGSRKSTVLRSCCGRGLEPFSTENGCKFTSGLFLYHQPLN